MVTYSEAGVDISLEEQTVKALTGELSETLDYQNIIKNDGHFAALVDFGSQAIAMSTDGVGSKILIANLMNKFDTVGITLNAVFLVQQCIDEFNSSFIMFNTVCVYVLITGSSFSSNLIKSFNSKVSLNLVINIASN